MSDTSTDTRIEPTLGDGDHERFAHYVDKNAIMSSAVEGHEVVALCGKRWVPSRNPDRFPVCPECKSIYQAMRSSGL